MMITSVGALLLISDDAARLAAFYREALELPLVDEEHQDVPLHYGCEIAGLHFAIHPAADWPGEPTPTSQSPVIVFYTADVHLVHERLVTMGVQATPPFDHGFATLTAFRDPDGNNVQVMTPPISTPPTRPAPPNAASRTCPEHDLAGQRPQEERDSR